MFRLGDCKGSSLELEEPFENWNSMYVYPIIAAMSVWLTSIVYCKWVSLASDEGLSARILCGGCVGVVERA